MTSLALPLMRFGGVLCAIRTELQRGMYAIFET